MPSLIDIRRRVRAVKSTQQITKAMKMVSSSKLRRAQERILRGRPFADEMLRVFNNLAAHTEKSAHPLLQDDPSAGRTLLVVITADRGLCGSFNTNVVKGALQFAAEQPSRPALALVGRPTASPSRLGADSSFAMVKSPATSMLSPVPQEDMQGSLVGRRSTTLRALLALIVNGIL